MGFHAGHLDVILPRALCGSSRSGRSPLGLQTQPATENLNANTSVQTCLASFNSWHKKNFPSLFLSYQVFSL